MVIENLVCEGCGATMRDFVKPTCLGCGSHDWAARSWPSTCVKCGGLVVMKCMRCGETKRFRKSPPFPFMA